MEFDKSHWAEKFELANDTLETLAQQGFASRLTLSKLTPELIKQGFKKLPLAQQLLLEDACENLRTPTPATVTDVHMVQSASTQEHGASGGASSGGSGLTAAEVAAFLDQGNSVLSDKDIAGKPQLFDPLQFDFSKPATSVPYRDIRDYISLVPKGSAPVSEGSIQIGAQEFLLKDSKIPWERMNVSQYMEGSIRIMREMAIQDKCSLGDILEYANYLVKISTLGQCFNWQSILKYDQAYRKAQAMNGFRWGADNSFLMQLYLKPDSYEKPQNTQPKKQTKTFSKNKRYKFDPESGNQICMKWNSVGGCKLLGCKFAHTCMNCYSAEHAQHACKPAAPHAPENP